MKRPKASNYKITNPKGLADFLCEMNEYINLIKLENNALKEKIKEYEPDFEYVINP